jgi:hypothetical protein
MKLFALALSLVLLQACAADVPVNSTTQSAADVPQNYTRFPSTSFASEGPWYFALAPDPNPPVSTGQYHPDPSNWDPTASPGHTGGDTQLLLRDVCDLYGSCQFLEWTNAYSSKIGTLPKNSTHDTYVKNSFFGNPIVSPGGLVYLQHNSISQICQPYVGWNLPLDQVETECDNQDKCNGFIMAKDDSHGELCAFVGANAILWLKVPQ